MQRRVMYREAPKKPPQRIWLRIPNAKMATFHHRLETSALKPQYKVNIEQDGPEHLITFNRKDFDLLHDLAKGLIVAWTN